MTRPSLRWNPTPEHWDPGQPSARPNYFTWDQKKCFPFNKKFESLLCRNFLYPLITTWTRNLDIDNSEKKFEVIISHVWSKKENIESHYDGQLVIGKLIFCPGFMWDRVSLLMSLLNSEGAMNVNVECWLTNDIFTSPYISLKKESLVAVFRVIVNLATDKFPSAQWFY